MIFRIVVSDVGRRPSVLLLALALALLLSTLGPIFPLELPVVGATPAAASGHDPSTVRVSVADDESQANGGSHSVDVSGDGRYVVFGSSASNLVSGGTTTFDVYLRDTQLGATELISQSTSGTAGNSTSGWPSIGDRPTACGGTRNENQTMRRLDHAK
jgi:hypothetical protein